MNIGKEFEKYAIKDKGISSNTLHGYINHNVTNLTPNIIEERPMNIAVMDVYSRLMMDRIIFLGYPVTEEVANIITAQLLFLESTSYNSCFTFLTSLTVISTSEACPMAPALG